MKRDPMFHKLKTYPPPSVWLVRNPACSMQIVFLFSQLWSLSDSFDISKVTPIYNLTKWLIFPGSDNKNIRWGIAIFLTLHILIFGYINTIFLYYIVESVARSVWSQTGRFVVVFLYRRNVRMILVYVIYEQGSDMTIFVFHTMVHLIQYC